MNALDSLRERSDVRSICVYLEVGDFEITIYRHTDITKKEQNFIYNIIYLTKKCQD